MIRDRDYMPPDEIVERDLRLFQDVMSALQDVDNYDNILRQVKRSDGQQPTETEYFRYKMTRDALLMKVQVATECLKQTSDFFKENFLAENVDLKRTFGLRDFISHSYGAINMKIVYGFINHSAEPIYHAVKDCHRYYTQRMQ